MIFLLGLLSNLSHINKLMWTWKGTWETPLSF